MIGGDRRAALAAMLLVAALAACAGGAPASPGRSGPAASPLAPGTYGSRVFQPAVSVTIPEGWEIPADTLGYFQVRPAGSELTGIHVFRDPHAASQDPACPQSPEPGVGTASSQLVAWMRELPGLTVSAPGIVSLGGLRGTMLDVAIAPGWTASCPFANGTPTVSLFMSPTYRYRWVVAGNERLRLYLLDLPGGGTVLVDVDAFDGRLIDQLLAAAVPVLGSMRFAIP